MPVTQARLPGFQSAKSARWYQALIGPIQATGSAGGFDSSENRTNPLLPPKNDPLAYADLILNGDPEKYLKNVTGSHRLEI